MVVEDNPVAGKPIEFRSLYDPIAHAAESVGTMVVCKYKNNVRPLLLFGGHILRDERRRSGCLN